MVSTMGGGGWSEGITSRRFVVHFGQRGIHVTNHSSSLGGAFNTKNSSAKLPTGIKCRTPDAYAIAFPSHTHRRVGASPLGQPLALQ